MQRWCRIRYRNQEYPGLDQNGQIELYQGSMLGSKTAMGTTVSPEQASDVSPLGIAVSKADPQMGLLGILKRQ